MSNKSDAAYFDRLELVKIRVFDVLVDGNVPPWLIDETIDAIEKAWKEGTEE